MWQQAVVALLVLAAGLWAAWYWMPVRWRRALAGRLSRGALRLGVGEGEARRIGQVVGEAPGCSSCDSCGSCATPGSPAVGRPQDASVAQKPVRFMPPR